jgi:hypothetical protein
MRKFPALPFIALLGLVFLLSACKLPAAVDLEDPSGDPVTLPRAPETPFETSAAYPVPGIPNTPVVEIQPTSEPATAPPPTPAAVTATSAPMQEPTATPSAPPPEPTVPPATTAPSSAQGERIAFQAGSTAADVRGELGAGQQTAYLLRANSGQTMTVSVWSPNGDVYLSVGGAGDGRVLQGADAKAASWSGPLPSNQDYVLMLTAAGGATSYSMNVTIPAGTAATTPTASASGAQLDPNKAFGTAKFTDNFDIPRNPNWVDPAGNLPNTDNIRLSYENNQFFVTGKQPGFQTWWFTWPSPKDFYLEMTVKTGECTGKDAYGVIVRGPEKGAGKSFGYIIAFSCDGAYQVLRLDSADPFTTVTLVDWTRSDRIKTGANQENVVGVKAEGKNWTIYANGYKIGETSDGTYLEGRFGVYTAPGTTANFRYQLIKLAYWQLD